MTHSLFLQHVTEHQAVCELVKTLEKDVDQVCRVIVEAVKAGGKIMLCGNGGSASDSQHIAAEFIGRFTKDREPIAALALNTDTSVLTCVGNDYAFDQIFARQIQGLGQPADVLIAISTSGNSANVINAVKQAKKLGMTSIGLLGRDGGALDKECDWSLIIAHQQTARIQEMHILLGHIICHRVETDLGMV